MKNAKNISVYIPVKFNTSVKGYWTDKAGKIYIDNILIQICNGLQALRIKANLFNSGELAIFYIQEDIAYIQSKDTLERLTDKIIIENVKTSDIPALLKRYSGLTYFETSQRVIIWK
jgi:hypothetical protein